MDPYETLPSQEQLQPSLDELIDTHSGDSEIRSHFWGGDVCALVRCANRTCLKNVLRKEEEDGTT